MASKRPFLSKIGNDDDDVVDLTTDYDVDESKPLTSKKANTKNSPAKKGASGSASSSRFLSVATYNIWFGVTGHEEKRMEAIIEALAPHSPHLIGFQEVTPSLAEMLTPLLESLNYHTILQPFGAYVCGVACKVDKILQSGFLPFSNSRMGRGIVWALVEKDDCEILFTTTHLESYLYQSFTGGPQREIQLEEMEEFCNRCMRERASVQYAIITGDLNWDDERARSDGHNRKLLDVIDAEKWADTYRQVEHKAKGYTYDPKENAMLGNGNIRRRFDRILVQKRDASPLQVSASEMVGMDAIPGLSYMTPPSQWHGPKKRLVLPSDHFGLVSKFVL